ncbi:MAG: C25 family cysteine peptidase [candidate division WOR-3 bacterium]
MSTFYRIAVIVLVFIGNFSAGEVIKIKDNWGRYPLFNLIKETPQGVEIVFSMNEMVIEEKEVDGVITKTFSVPGFFLPNREGAPNILGTGRYIAIPEGSTPKLTILETRTETFYNIEVTPAPNIPMDSDNKPVRYVKDMNIYSKNEYYPNSPVCLSPIQEIRGVDVVLLGVTPFQYNPVTKELIVYKDIKIKIDFIGGTGHFGEDRLRSRFWEPILENHILNYNSLPKIDFYSPERINSRAGYEYIIIVPNDATFEAWADTIKRWRKLQGISTEVYTLSEVGGSDSASIKNFIQNAYNTWNPAPVAVLFLSDYPSSGRDYGITSPSFALPPPDPDGVSDNWYVDFNNDTLPELHYGRICAQDNAQLDTMIHKFLNYERNPPTSTNFYNNPLVSCSWETDRWFQLCSEVIRGFFIHNLGKSPNRQYTVSDGSPSIGCAWSTATNTRSVVQYWYNVGWLDDTLNQHDSTWWSNGSNIGITNAINSGAFLVQHRDHGYEFGWLHPSFTNNDLDGLTNQLPPFVYSTNCLTGRYQWSYECFSEKFHRRNHGALGVNCASTASPSFCNDAYIWGTYDCLWPQFDPGYPTFGRIIGSSDLRPCLAMTSGKYYLSASSWPGNPQSKSRVWREFHHFGDCFITLYSRTPLRLTVNHPMTIEPGQTYFTATATSGSVIALTANGEIIGAALATGAPINIPITPQYSGTVVITVTKANYYRYSANIKVLSLSAGANSRFTAIGAYKDTILVVFECTGAAVPYYCKYETSYDGGASWYWGIPAGEDTTISACCPDITAKMNGGQAIIYAYGDGSSRRFRYTWRDYHGSWSTPVQFGDYRPRNDVKPSIEYLSNGVYGSVYVSYSPVYGGVYFDRNDWQIGIGENESEQSKNISFIITPNPSSEWASLTYTNKEEDRIKISLYDVTGRLIKNVIDKVIPAGKHTIKLINNELPSGIYFVRLESSGATISKIMTIIR